MPDLPSCTPIADAPLSVVLIAEQGNPDFEGVVAAWSALLDELARPAEILLVQSDVGEAAGRLGDALKERFPRLQVLRHESRRGVGAALQTGILAAQHPLLAYAPADKQFQPGDVKLLLKEINQVDLVTGYRVHGPVPAWLAALDFCWHWLARILVGYQTERRDTWLGWPGWGRRWLARWIFGVRVKDPECPFRLFRRELFRRIPIQSQNDFAQIEILAKANHLGALMAEAPVGWTPPQRVADTKQARRLRRDAYRLLKDADFSIMPLQEPAAWSKPATSTGMYRLPRYYRLPKELTAFALEYEVCFEQAVRRRMAEVGVPDSVIGQIPGDPGAFSNRHAVAGTNAVPMAHQPYTPAINVDPALLDADLADPRLVPSWRSASWKDRLDAVIAHEFEEALAPLPAGLWETTRREGHVTEDILLFRHHHAVAQGPTSQLSISFTARKILAEYARSKRLQ